MIYGIDGTLFVLYTTVGLLTIAVAVLMIQFFRLQRHYRQLLGSSKTMDLETLLKQVITTQKKQDAQLTLHQKHLETLQTKSRSFLQRIGFQRFNPFQDTGGDQSFVLAILDQDKNGMVFSSLHNREVTRLYAKPVMAANEADIPLSDEEKAVVASAKLLGNNEYLS